MSGFVTMLKMKMKLLLRNPGYLAFLVLLPVCAVLLLNLNMQTVYPPEGDKGNVILVEKESIKIQDTSGLKLNVFVYDYAATELSKVFLDTLQSTGSVQIYCYQGEENKSTQTQKEALIDKINTNTINAVLVLEPDFDTLLGSGDFESSLSLYYGHEDGRVAMLEDTVNQFMDTHRILSAISGEGVIERLNARIDALPEIKSTEIGLKNGYVINKEQNWQLYNVKFSWAVITMAFLFSGVFVSNIIIMERNNGVLKRTKLSGSGMVGYGVVKFLLTLSTVILQTAIMGIGIKLFVKVDFGISIWQYLVLTFGLALVLNAISVVIGIITNNLLNTSYAVFFVATITSLFSGLYFPGEIGGWIGNASSLTPQTWGIRAAEKLLAGAENAFLMYGLAIAGFMFILFCVGLLGLNLIQKEDQ